MSVHLEGFEELKRKLQRMPAEWRSEMESFLPTEGDRLKDEANAVAPKRSGTLVHSSIAETTSDSDGVSVIVAYHDEKAPAVHEGIHWSVKIEGTRGFKWYERTFNAFEPGFYQRLVTRARAVLERGK